MRPLVLTLLLALPAEVPAQQWNAPEVLALVDRAIAARRSAQSAAAQYRARAQGLVFFLVETGTAATPVLAKADQLVVEVYWQPPDRSKQNIVAWRERTWFPSDLHYHRDHLGIVTNDFGDTIRIGEGDEVRDVPHPVSAGGRREYDYAAGRAVTLRGRGGELQVHEVTVRPKDPSLPRVAGALYVEAGTGALVRFRFSFTAAAYLQPELEDITVALENALHEGQWWLPYRQEIAIRRRATWLDFPLRTVIQGQWEVTSYDFEAEFGAEVFAGGQYGGLRAPGEGGAEAEPAWAESLESITRRAIGDRPGARGTTADLAAIRRDVVNALGQAIARRRPTRLAFGSVSDLIRVNRVQGVVVGAGASVGLGIPGARFHPYLAYGMADRRLAGSGVLQLHRDDWAVSFQFATSVSDISDRPVISQALNSVLAGGLGKDYGDWVWVDRFGGTVSWTPAQAIGWRVRVERQRSVSVAAVGQPLVGEHRPNPALGSGWNSLVGLGMERSVGRSEYHLDLEVGSGGGGYVRGFTHARWSAGVGPGALRAEIEAGAATSNTPKWRTFVLGGRGSLPGEPYRAFGGRWSVLGRVEWLFAGGAVPGVLALGPLFAVGTSGEPLPDLPWGTSGGPRPVVGVASELLFGVIRIEAGWALRSGGLGITVDAGRAWWPML